jgi:hypothetical protein
LNHGQSRLHPSINSEGKMKSLAILVRDARRRNKRQPKSRERLTVDLADMQAQDIGDLRLLRRLIYGSSD